MIFFFAMEIIARWQGSVVVVAPILLLASFYGAKKITRKWKFSIIPVIFSLTALTLLYLIDSEMQKQLFIALSTLMYYLSLLGSFRLRRFSGDQTARGMIAASLAATMFLFYSATYGVYLNFIIQEWVLMILFLGATFMVSYQYFISINENSYEVINYSVLLGFVMAEVAWVINFWPFGYLTTGVILLIFYYILWDLIQSYFLNILSKKRVVANMLFFSSLIGLILFSSKWLPNI